MEDKLTKTQKKILKSISKEDMKVKQMINAWRKRIERIQERGRKSVNNPEDLSNGLYAWLDLDDIIQDMDYYVTH